MKILSPTEEQRLASAIERAIELTNTGLEPSNAMEKVAREQQFTPPFIRRAVGVFNKSLAVHRMRTLPQETRKQEFPLADADRVIQQVYNTNDELSLQKAASAAPEAPATLPKGEFTPKGLSQPMLDKAARSIDSMLGVMTVGSALTKIQKLEAARDKVTQRIQGQVTEARTKMMLALDKVASDVRYMPKEAQQRMAQLVVNGYPLTGTQFLNLIADKAQRTLPEVKPTAKAAVFPQEPVFFKIAEAHAEASRMARAEQELESFEKYASISLGSILGDAKSDISTLLAHIPESERAKTKIRPDIFNKLKEIDARRAFMDVALYDNDLNTYDMPTLIGAYNSAVQSSPDIQKRPGMLKAVMLQRVNSGNMADTFQIKLEQEIMEKAQKTDDARIKQIQTTELADRSKTDVVSLSDVLNEAKGKHKEKAPAKSDSKPAKAADKPKDEKKPIDPLDAIEAKLSADQKTNIAGILQDTTLKADKREDVLKIYEKATTQGYSTLTKDEQDVYTRLTT